MPRRVGDWQEQPNQGFYAQGLYVESSSPKHRLGTIRRTDDGRVFVYCKAGGTPLAAGKLCQATVQVAEHLNIAVAANAAIGDKRVSVTLGAADATVDFYKDGFLYVNDGAGVGIQYKVRGHKLIAGSGTGWIELYDALRIALTSAASKVTLSNIYNGTIVHPNPPTAALVGIPVLSVTAAYYYWSQVKGLATCLISGTPAINGNLKPGGAAGALAVAVETEILYDSVGYLVNTGVDAKYKLVQLNIPGF